jgi:hypothetical protein
VGLISPKRALLFSQPGLLTTPLFSSPVIGFAPRKVARLRHERSQGGETAGKCENRRRRGLRDCVGYRAGADSHAGNTSSNLVGVTIKARLRPGLFFLPSAAGQDDVIFAYGGVTVANTDRGNVYGRSRSRLARPRARKRQRLCGRRGFEEAQGTSKISAICRTIDFTPVSLADAKGFEPPTSASGVAESTV